MQQELFSPFDKDKILLDLFQAYFDARKNKRNTINALKFELHFESNLFALHEEIINCNYEPKPSICFIVNKPIKREIFAADFRDRIIHHLLFNYISPIFEKTFINDSYSCRKGKGTHYGIKRIDGFIRSCSQNFTKDCYIFKLDIKGYFMAMNKNLLYKIVTDHIKTYKYRKKLVSKKLSACWLNRVEIKNKYSKLELKNSLCDVLSLPKCHATLCHGEPVEP